MPAIDLTRYIYDANGTWTDPSTAPDASLFGFTQADTFSSSRLMLRWVGDFVALAGPLRVRVTVQAENLTLPLAYIPNFSGETTKKIDQTVLFKSVRGRLNLLRPQASTIYSYTLDIEAGQAWPFVLAEVVSQPGSPAARLDQIGNNLGYRVIIEPAFATATCEPILPGSDLPCDFAVADRPDTARFFPSACEPCGGQVVGLPPGSTASMVTPPAAGGCVRTRFFNGMFITREDLETEQRYQRLKSKLHNRAAGAGVVWGLGVGKQGSQVWVLPGYGVDCCGNDLALTTTYQVESAALLADPAAAGVAYKQGPQRMHLLLEYVECPSEPRPVHGDPCSTEASRCEMSRIRESVRLRLVPPRDYDAAKESAPIQQFLDEVRSLQASYPLDTLNLAGIDRAPFRLNIRAASVQIGNVWVRPSASSSNDQFKPLLGDHSTVTVEIVPDPLWTFVGGSVTTQVLADGKPVDGIANPSTPVDLSLADGFSNPNLTTQFNLKGNAAGLFPQQIVFKISNWQAQTLFAAPDDPAPQGELTLTFQFDPNRRLTRVSLAASAIAVRPLDLAARPCGSEPCASRQNLDAKFREFVGKASLNANADPTPVLPWLHIDPTHPDSSGDPKVLVLAALGGWLMQMLVREGAGTATEALTPRRLIAQAIYRLAWLFLFGLSEKADPAALGSTLRRLLEAWCDGLLWKGPQCCGDPHGVVIGCAVVEGGTIQRIDPWGGRRYVVHYPLLAHWGAQFGLAPLDVSAARFFSTLCCIGNLPGIGVDTPEIPSGLLPIGGGYLALGDPANFSSQLERQKIITVAQRPVGLPEMLALIVTLVGTTRKDNNQFTALELADFAAGQTVVLFYPDPDDGKQKL